MDFSCNENKNFLQQTCWSFNMHTFAKYEIIWQNYPLKLDITLLEYMWILFCQTFNLLGQVQQFPYFFP